MMLYPLAEVGIGVLVTIVVRSSQFVMDILRHGQRRKPKEDTDHPQSHSRTEQTNEALWLYRQQHHDVRMKAPV
jgi:ribosomal 50S subunit-recycling heat shock protein